MVHYFMFQSIDDNNNVIYHILRDYSSTVDSPLPISPFLCFFIGRSNCYGALCVMN